ncbi:hypothetical protein G7078_04980 [Sphingomonas sinipercae]|uniref:Uncharacterized protein n=1 Tax=Sphingomonas sinipercae TaxID=2714944 RepID=A0A6G7ZMQ1_9SPHN|nr:hypothetical protein [Sphingomonas sinipercae]QIL02202.1 hypothetical protein G7078_04980 [Sphingomonas sinipercae]
MDALAIIVAVVLGFIALKFISGMIKFAVLAVIVVAAVLFLTGGFGG